METIQFVLDNAPVIAGMAVEHISIVAVAVGLAILTGVPIGIAITQNRAVADTVLYVASIIVTIPSIALFGLMIPVLSLIGQGIGWLPAVIAILLYSQLPIVRNTYTAITNVDPALHEAARGMGMTALQRLWQVEIPIAVPVIMANRTGTEHGLTFWGGSRIVDPFGRELAVAGTGEELITATLDYATVRRARHLLPTVRDSNIGLIHRETARLIDNLGVPDFVRDGA